MTDVKFESPPKCDVSDNSLFHDHKGNLIFSDFPLGIKGKKALKLKLLTFRSGLKYAIFFFVAICFMAGCHNKAVNSKEINLKLDSLSVNGKSLIEDGISKEKGVYFVKAHLRKKIVTIVYDTTLQNLVQLSGMLEKMGYKSEVTMPPVPDKDK